MPRALIGHTGFVGGNLLQQVRFDDLYNSSNIQNIGGRHYELLVCAGAPGAKWKANQEPARDLASTQNLMTWLGKASADHVILISTVDVYPTPVAVDEETAIVDDVCSPYGRHRLRLEEFIRDRFESTIIRLPGLFGPGLKKNVIYDFLHDHRVDKICPDSVFQFYPLERTWNDMQVVRNNQLRLVNFATEPTSVRDIAKKAFGFEFRKSDATGAVRYDVRTKHARLFGKPSVYIYDAEEILEALKEFVSGSRSSRP